jgi:hypothetical protein
LLALNVGLIVGTVTEGGHDAVDSIGGIATALAARWLAQKFFWRAGAAKAFRAAIRVPRLPLKTVLTPPQRRAYTGH